MPGRALDLAHWINEREMVRIRKENGDPPPWTDDGNIAHVRYCNVHREDDKVTKWIAFNWREPLGGSPLLTLAMVAARMINWPDTLEYINTAPLEQENPALFLSSCKDAIWGQRKRGKKAWTSAYTISTCGRAMAKEDYVVDHVLAQVAEKTWVYDNDNLASAHERLTMVDGLGSFLAGQVVADLKNTLAHPLQGADDYWSWSAHGPGSLRGLDAYWNGAFCGRKITPSLYSMAINACYHEVMPHVKDYVGKIHMQDFQNCLCEFSKYIRVREGSGRVRNTYSASR